MNIKKISYLVFLIISFIACDKKDDQLIEEALFIHSKSIQQIKKALFELRKEIERKADDYYVDRYRLIEKEVKMTSLAYEKLEYKFDDIGKNIKERSNEQAVAASIQDFEGKIDELQDHLLENYKQMLQDHNDKVIGFNDEEETESIEEVKEILHQYKRGFLIDKWNTEQLNFEHWLTLTKSNVANLFLEYAYYLNDLAGSQIACWFDSPFYPYVLSKNSCVKRGEYFDAVIGIGTRVTSLRPKDLAIFADGELLEIGEDGTATFKKKITKKTTSSIHHRTGQKKEIASGLLIFG